MTKTCVSCGKEFKGRTDKRTCSDACRAKQYRRRKDPLLGSPERKQNQLEGLNKRYTYRQRGQARFGLRGIGLTPIGWGDGFKPAPLVNGSPGDSDGSPQFVVAMPYDYRGKLVVTDPAERLKLRRTDTRAMITFPVPEVLVRIPVSPNDKLRYGIEFSEMWKPIVPVHDGEGGMVCFGYGLSWYDDPSVGKSPGFYWVPGDYQGRELPGDRELVAEVQLSRRRLSRCLPRLEHRLGQPLKKNERRLLERLVTVSPETELERKVRHEVRTAGFQLWKRRVTGHPYEYCGEVLSYESWLKKFDAEPLVKEFDPEFAAWVRAELSVTEHTKREGQNMLLIPTDDEVAEDTERLMRMSHELFEIAVRLQERFPESEKVQRAVDKFLAQAQLS